MKSSYYLNIDIVSRRKFTNGDVEKIKSSLDLNEDFLDLCSILSESISMNFSSHIEIYAEDIEFDVDKLSEIEKLVDIIDTFIPGGCGNDSKIEWTSEYPDTSSLWFKNDDTWELVVKDHDRGIWREEEEWDNTDSNYGYSGDLDPEDNW